MWFRWILNDSTRWASHKESGKETLLCCQVFAPILKPAVECGTYGVGGGGGGGGWHYAGRSASMRSPLGGAGPVTLRSAEVRRLPLSS